MMFVLQVHQDFAHHVQSEPVETVGSWVIFPWPIAVPEGWDRVSTPLLTPARLEALRAECAGVDVPPADPKPIPEPQPESEDTREI